MSIYYSIVFFLIGVYLGDFYSVIGYRLPNKERILFPSINENENKVNYLKLIPLFSYFILRRKGYQNISIVSFLFELLSGILFLVTYLIFGFSLETLFALTFISLLLIIIVSDYYYMVICDEVLIIFSLLLIIEIFVIRGFNGLCFSLLSALISFAVMFLIKLLGDFLFKKESMGGGDIKLLCVFGLVLGLPTSLFTIFIGSIVALPISLFYLKKKDSNIIPFGPFLSMAAIVLLLFNPTIMSFFKFILF